MVKYDKNLNKMVEDLTDFKSFKTFAMEAIKLTGEIQDLVDGKNMGFIKTWQKPVLLWQTKLSMTTLN